MIHLNPLRWAPQLHCECCAKNKRERSWRESLPRHAPKTKLPAEQGRVFAKRAVAVVFMEYPHPQLPFADSDLEALQEQEFTVITIALRGRYFINGGIAAGQSILKGFLGAGAWEVLRSVGWTGLRAAFFNGDGFADTLKTALLAPRAFAAIAHLREIKVSHLHLFWGHYPSVMGILWKLSDASHTLTISLGAYDIEKKLRVSAKATEIADSVTTHSEFNRHRLVSGWGLRESKVAVIYRGVNTDLFRRSGQAPLDPNKFLIISAGRLIKEKNIDATLSLFAELRRLKPEIRLSIAGRGPDLERLQGVTRTKKLDGCTDFVGHLAHSELKRLMQSARLIIFTSVKRGEILPNAIKESMSCGVVPVVLRHPAIDELIEDGVDGFLFSESDPLQAIAQRIVNSDLVVMSHNARQKIERKFNRAHSATQFTALLSGFESSARHFDAPEAAT